MVRAQLREPQSRKGPFGIRLNESKLLLLEAARREVAKSRVFIVPRRRRSFGLCARGYLGIALRLTEIELAERFRTQARNPPQDCVSSSDVTHAILQEHLKNDLPVPDRLVEAPCPEASGQGSGTMLGCE
jgi:hypothetical protein